MSQVAKIFFHDQRAATLFKTGEGYLFWYLPNYLTSSNSKALSISLPLTINKRTYTSMPSFFQGLLPEGWLNKISRDATQLRLSDFDLLIQFGEDLPGAVKIEEGDADDLSHMPK